MKFLKGIFGFFKIPLQIAIGLYFAFVLLVGTVGVINYYAEDYDYYEDYDFCEDLEFLVDYKPIAISLKHIS